MGAVVLADPGDGARAGSWRRFALPTLLILGWVGLFAYSAAYLTEDLPFRPSMPEAGPSAGSSAGPRACLLYTSPSPRDRTRSRMPSSA